jgi:predicted HAD superfamily phosphohydrolase YqeG
MPWVINFSLDPDKGNVGTATAVFTDTDNTVFNFSRRTDTTPAAFQAFVQAAIAVKQTWIIRKQNESVAITNLVTGFTGGGEIATGGTPI